jgi:hypothetical protein
MYSMELVNSKLPLSRDVKYTESGTSLKDQMLSRVTDISFSNFSHIGLEGSLHMTTAGSFSSRGRVAPVYM